MSTSVARVMMPAVSRVERNLLVVLAVLLAVGVFLRGAPQPETPYDLDAPSPQGLLALRLWLEEMGYEVRLLDQVTPATLAGEVLFVFPGPHLFGEYEADAVEEWVAGGGVLVLIGPAALDDALYDAFGVQPAADIGIVGRLRQVQPILPLRLAAWPAPGNVRGLDLADAPHALPVIAGEPVAGSELRITAALQPRGEGLIWHLDPLHDFTNARLRNLDQAALVPAVLRLTPSSGPDGTTTVLLDTRQTNVEAHPVAIASLQQWLYGTSWGIAILLFCGLLLAYLALQGVRLGPPVEDASVVRNREAAEYVAAMAGLYQRGNRREAVTGHVKRRLKLALGRQVGLQADEPDARFVEAWREQTGDSSQAEELAGLLSRLDGMPNDEQLLQAARDALAFEAKKAV